MNEYIRIYQNARNEGRSEYESLGIAASHIAASGTEKDLFDVYVYFSDDLLENTKEFFGEVTKNERITSAS